MWQHVPVRTNEWQTEVRDWIFAMTGSKVGELHHVQSKPWSSVWKAFDGDRTIWFEENVGTGLHEGPLQEVLARLAPDFVDAPLAWDRQRGWLLTLDGGPTANEAAPPISLFTEVVADYARLQRRTLGAGPELVAAGLPTARPQECIRQLESLVAEMAALPATDARHLSPSEAARVLVERERLLEAAGLLASGPIACALQHNDLSLGNVFVRRPTGHFVFFDFAESLWAHPFGSMLTVQWALLNRFGLGPDGDGPIDLRHQEIRRVFAAYLRVWSDLGDADQLWSLLAAALELAPLQRAMAWLQVLRAAPHEAVLKHGGTAREWLLDLTRPVLLD